MQNSYSPGTYYKRIWRPQNPNPPCPPPPVDREKLVNSLVALKVLVERLEELFETIEPCQDNLLVYGHKIREIILLACMEVESSWSAVLNENNYKTKGKFFTTKDYFKLKDPMFLDGYELKLSLYPQYPMFAPFENWSEKDPTGSLAWYNSYNKIKHDRENNLKLATLENAITSVGAAFVMIGAQFGFRWGTPFYPQHLTNSTFGLITVKLKNYESQYYIPPQSREWTSIDYQF